MDFGGSWRGPPGECRRAPSGSGRGVVSPGGSTCGTNGSALYRIRWKMKRPNGSAGPPADTGNPCRSMIRALGWVSASGDV